MLPWWAARRGGGDTSRACRQAGERSTTGPSTPRRPRARGRARALDRVHLPATRGWSISKLSAVRSSRSIFAPPISGQISTDGLGRRADHLYSRGEWTFADRDRRNGYSVVLFDRRARAGDTLRPTDRRRPSAHRRVERADHLSRGSRSAPLHAMPPGGFRLAIINCHDLATGRAARARLRAQFARP